MYLQSASKNSQSEALHVALPGGVIPKVWSPSKQRWNFHDQTDHSRSPPGAPQLHEHMA